jgi:galactose mutarotase-like enzyme
MFHASASESAVELRDDEGESSVTVVPSRGAIATRFRVGDRDLLYLDEPTLADPTKNVRGGIPVLFPSPGPLTGGRFARGGKSGAMKQHGFARDLAWRVGETQAGGGVARATVHLESTDATRAMYPWSFRFALTFSLAGATLRLDAKIDNAGREPMPFAFGLHPYFRVTDKSAARIATRATRAFDNVTKQVVPFHGFDLAAKEVDLHLLDHDSAESELAWGDGSRLAIRASPEHAPWRWVVWTLAGRDFVCVEPWTAPADALNTGESLITLGPGESRQLGVSFEYSRGSASPG